MAQKVLYLFTAEYPYGSQESYLENEIVFLAEAFDKIYLFPRSNTKKNARQIPQNVIIEDTYDDITSNYISSQTFGTNFFQIAKILFLEFFYTEKKLFFLKNIRHWNSSICQCVYLSAKVKSHIEVNSTNIETKVIYYSYWMNDWATVLSLLKDKAVVKKFVFRVLGYDIYDERWEQGYIPFRYYIYSRAAKIYSVSKSAEKYIRNKNIFPNKITYSYFGTKDYGFATDIPKDEFIIYSCSNIIKLKRLPLIVDILKHFKFDVKWIHRGDGEDKAELLELIKTLPSNVQFELLPRINDYACVLNHLKNTPVNLFINVSESEGLPVTIMEAISMGIPVLATDVGGTSEIVTEETGILVEKNFNPIEVARVIKEFKESKKNTVEFRVGVRAFWKENFDATKNYQFFCNKLLS